LQEFSSMLQDFPVREVLDNLAKTSAALAKLTSDEEIGATIAAAKRALDDVSELVARLETRTRPLEPMLVDAQQALAESRKTFAQASQTLAAAERTFNEASATLAPMKSLVADDSEILGAIDDALAAMTDAARAVAALAETLERRPEALIRGKGVLGGD
jgi:paraquat-inducible protein B